jgi:hypothetical protein
MQKIIIVTYPEGADEAVIKADADIKLMLDEAVTYLRKSL